MAFKPLPLHDITNKPKRYRLNADLEQEYAAVRVGTSNSYAADELRAIGCKAINLWVEGHIYPSDPLTNASPPFCNVTELLRFIGDGKGGLFGYCYRLHTLVIGGLEAHKQLFVGYSSLQQKYVEDIKKVQDKANQTCNQLNEEIRKLTLKLSQQKEEQERRVDNYIQMQHTARNMRRRIDHLTHISLGFNVRKRKRQAMSMLSSSGGARKKHIR